MTGAEPGNGRQVNRELFEREADAVCRYVEMALQAPTQDEAKTLLRLARRRLDDATKMAVPEGQRPFGEAAEG